MKTYKVTFHGREAGALGIRYWITDMVQAKDKDGILLALYDKYECISEIKSAEEI